MIEIDEDENLALALKYGKEVICLDIEVPDNCFHNKYKNGVLFTWYKPIDLNIRSTTAEKIMLSSGLQINGFKDLRGHCNFDETRYGPVIERGGVYTLKYDCIRSGEIEKYMDFWKIED